MVKDKTGVFFKGLPSSQFIHDLTPSLDGHRLSPNTLSVMEYTHSAKLGIMKGLGSEGNVVLNCLPN